MYVLRYINIESLIIHDVSCYIGQIIFIFIFMFSFVLSQIFCSRDVGVNPYTYQNVYVFFVNQVLNGLMVILNQCYQLLHFITLYYGCILDSFLYLYGFHTIRNVSIDYSCIYFSAIWWGFLNNWILIVWFVY